MPSRTVRLHGVVLASVAATYVHRMRNGVEVVRPDARMDSAEVVERLVIGEWPDHLLVAPAVRAVVLVAVGVNHIELAVPMPIERLSPNPARTEIWSLSWDRPSLIDL